MDDPREVPAGSREEAHVTESILYGLVGSMLERTTPLIQERFAFDGVTISRAEEPADSGVIFDGLTIHMASGDYRVTIEQERAA